VRIAQIAPLYESVPPVGYGGTERVIAGLCDGLVALGHEVTLFAAGRSMTRARFEPIVACPLRLRMSPQEMIDVAPHLHLRMLADVYRRAGDFDIIHSHADVWTLPFTDNAAAPTVITLHGRLDLEHVRQTIPLYPQVPFVSISDHQRTALDGLDVNWADTVYNGLALDRYHAATRGDGRYLAFIGRINPEKGPELAVEIARRTSRTLHVAAKVDPLDVQYYRHRVEPLFEANDVRFLGELGEQDKPSFYAHAAATLFPSDWPEPFGLVMIESMAAGTPVIALRRGAVPEIIIDGVTGFVCDDVDEMVAAVDRLPDIDPDDCRRHAASFDIITMCAAYERVYESIVVDHAGELVSDSA
jgi:glycosyltransferase involved in cell wall biosynthesis